MDVPVPVALSAGNLWPYIRKGVEELPPDHWASSASTTLLAAESPEMALLLPRMLLAC